MEETNVTNQVNDNEIIETGTPEETTKNVLVVDVADYATLDTEDLIAAVKSLVDTAPIQSIKAQIDEAKKIFYDRSNEAYKIALEKFKVEKGESEGEGEGEEQEDFDYNYPHTNTFKTVLRMKAFWTILLLLLIIGSN